MPYDPLDAENDTFRPTAISTLVGCLHCGEEYDSYRIEWRVETDHNGRAHGFWCCPIPNCDGRGFGFDIFPIDPNYRDEDGNKIWVDESEEDKNDPDDELDLGDGDGNYHGGDEPIDTDR